MVEEDGVRGNVIGEDVGNDDEWGAGGDVAAFDEEGAGALDGVIDIRGEGEKAEATIRFSLVGTKHLSLAWAPLKAV